MTELQGTMIVENGEPYTPEEWAAMWGCDPRYDRAPRHQGDGYLFYNFGSDILDATPEWYNGFIGAIDRTIQMIEISGDRYTEDDLENMRTLKEYVEYLLKMEEMPV